LLHLNLQLLVSNFLQIVSAKINCNIWLDFQSKSSKSNNKTFLVVIVAFCSF